MNTELNVFLNETFLPSFSSRSVDDNWMLLMNKMSELIDKYVPLISISNDKTNPWFNKHLKQLRNKKKRLYMNGKHASSPSSWASMPEY